MEQKSIENSYAGSSMIFGDEDWRSPISQLHADCGGMTESIHFGTCSWKSDFWRGLVYADSPRIKHLAE